MKLYVHSLVDELKVRSNLRRDSRGQTAFVFLLLLYSDNENQGLLKIQTHENSMREIFIKIIWLPLKLNRLLTLYCHFGRVQ